MTADFHCHTRLSDGSISIEHLVALAKKKEVDIIAITDHDCLAGAVRAKVLGERSGVNVVAGVELSSFDPELGKEIHILCYMPDEPDRLEGLCRKNQLARKKASQFMILKVASRFPISGDLVLKCGTGSTNVFKQHVMQALMECNLTNDFWGDLYNELFSPESSSNVIVQPQYPLPADIIESVREAGGISVLAHPAHTGIPFDYIDGLLEKGLIGIEAWHPAHDSKQTSEILKYARSNNLLMTGGSDFHGMYTPGITGLGGIEIPQQHISALMNYKSRQRRLAKKLLQDQQALKED